MKKIIQCSFVFATLFCAGFTTTLNAQDVDKEMADFAQRFQDAYNKEDHAALKTFYTADAVRVGSDGVSITGADAIANFWAEQFKGADATLMLKQTSVVWKDVCHCNVSTGTYHVSGATVKGDKIEASGTYSNEMLKINGDWKMARSVLGN